MTLQEARKAKQWTSADVAEYLGVSASTIRQIEAGTRYPSYPLLCKMEKLFAMRHTDLIPVKHKVPHSDIVHFE